jgi:hypothetical protein
VPLTQLARWQRQLVVLYLSVARHVHIGSSYVLIQRHSHAHKRYGCNNGQQVALTLIARYCQRLRSFRVTIPAGSSEVDICMPYDFKRQWVVYSDYRYDHHWPPPPPQHDDPIEWQAHVHLQLMTQRILSRNYQTLECISLPMNFRPYSRQQDSQYWMTVMVWLERCKALRSLSISSSSHIENGQVGQFDIPQSVALINALTHIITVCSSTLVNVSVPPHLLLGVDEDIDRPEERKGARKRLLNAIVAIPSFHHFRTDSSCHDGDGSDHSTIVMDSHPHVTRATTSLDSQSSFTCASLSLPQYFDFDMSWSGVENYNCSPVALNGIRLPSCSTHNHDAMLLLAPYMIRININLSCPFPHTQRSWCNSLINLQSLSLGIVHHNFRQQREPRHYIDITDTFVWRLPALISCELSYTVSHTSVCIIDAPLLRHWHAPSSLLLVSQLKLLITAHELVSIAFHDWSTLPYTRIPEQLINIIGHGRYNKAHNDDEWDNQGLSSLANIALTSGVSIWPKLERFVGCTGDGLSICYPLLQSSLLLSNQRLRIIRFNCIKFTVHDIWTIITNNNMTLECLLINTPSYHSDSDHSSNRVKQVNRKRRRDVQRQEEEEERAKDHHQAAADASSSLSSSQPSSSSSNDSSTMTSNENNSKEKVKRKRGKKSKKSTKVVAIKVEEAQTTKQMEHKSNTRENKVYVAKKIQSFLPEIMRQVKLSTRRQQQQQRGSLTTPSHSQHLSSSNSNVSSSASTLDSVVICEKVIVMPSLVSLHTSLFHVSFIDQLKLPSLRSVRPSFFHLTQLPSQMPFEMSVFP